MNKKDMEERIRDLQTRMYAVERKVEYPNAEKMLFSKHSNAETNIFNSDDYFSKDTTAVVRMILDYLDLELEYKPESVELKRKIKGDK